MKKEYPVFKTSILYLLLGFMLYFAGAYFQSEEIYSGLLMTEYVLVLLPNIMYLLAKELDLKEYLRLNRINFKQVIYIFFIILFAYPVAVLLNAIGLVLVNLFTTYVPDSVPLPTDFKMYLFSIFVIGISPGICEEIMFRGTMMKGYESLGKKKAIILSSILFGVFHFNIQNLIGPIFLGIILGILVYKSNSIYSSILGHGLNNGIAMTIGYLINRTREVDFAKVGMMGESNLLFIMASAIGFITISFVFMVYLIKTFPKEEPEEKREIVIEKAEAWEYLPLVLVFILFIWVNGRVYFNLF